MIHNPIADIVLKLCMNNADIQPKPLIDVDDDMMSSPVAGKQDRRPSLPSSNGDQSLESMLVIIHVPSYLF